MIDEHLGIEIDTFDNLVTFDNFDNALGSQNTLGSQTFLGSEIILGYQTIRDLKNSGVSKFSRDLLTVLT